MSEDWFYRKVWIVLISLMVLCEFFGCAPVDKKPMPQPSDKNVLRVGVSTNAPPLISLFTEEYLAWAIRKEDVQLLKSANTFLEALNKNRKLEPMIRRWIPFTN